MSGRDVFVVVGNDQPGRTPECVAFRYDMCSPLNAPDSPPHKLPYLQSRQPDGRTDVVALCSRYLARQACTNTRMPDVLGPGLSPRTYLQALSVYLGRASLHPGQSARIRVNCVDCRRWRPMPSCTPRAGAAARPGDCRAM
jgi:hypothetical protein